VALSTTDMLQALTGADKEVQDHLDNLMAQEGTIGYCLINFDGKETLHLLINAGIPIRYMPKAGPNDEA